MTSESGSPPSLPALLRDLRDETTTLLRQELQLAKAELKENASHMARDAAQIAIGGAVGYAGLIVLLIGLGLLISWLLTRAGMAPDVARWLSIGGVGVIVGGIGLGMVARAKHAMTNDDLAPKQTLATMRENKDWAQSKLQHSP